MNGLSLIVILFTASFNAISSQNTPPSTDDIIFEDPSADDDSFTYDDLVSLGASCSPDDTCSGYSSRSRLLSSHRDKTCTCDQHCEKFGDCCINSPFRINRDNGQSREKFSCIPIFGQYFTVKTRCQAGWRDEAVRRMCEEEAPLSDPLRHLPVTHPASGVTFKNAFCAQCNGVSANYEATALGQEQEVLLWMTKASCPTLNDMSNENISSDHLSDYVMENLVYFESVHSWGVPVPGPNETHEIHYCELNPFPSEFAQEFLRRCEVTTYTRDLVSHCPINYTDNKVYDACESYQGFLYTTNSDRPTVYRNAHCALCHGVNISSLACIPRTQKTFVYSQDVQPKNFDFSSSSFTILFEGGKMKHKVKCTFGQVFDPFRKVCRSLTCSHNYNLVDGKCVPRSTGNFVEIELTTMATMTSTESFFASCPKIVLEADSFLLLRNGSVFLIEERILLSEGNYSLVNGSLLACTKIVESNEIKLSSIQGLLSMVGMTVSIVCLILHLICFLILPEMRNMSGKNLASLSLTLLVGYSCFLIRKLPMIVEDHTSCSILGGVMYGAFLSSFLWTSVLSFDVWRTLRLASSQLKVSTGKQSGRYLLYALYAFVSAILISIVVVYIEMNIIQLSLFANEDGVPEIDLRPNFTQGFCWFGNRTSLLTFFVVPVALILLINVIFFVLTSCIIVKTSRSSKLKASNNSSVTSQGRRDFKLYLRLSLLMGLSWILGVVAGLTDHSEESWLSPLLWMIFILLNSFQGLFILWSFTCGRKNRHLLKERINNSTPFATLSEAWSFSSPRNSSHSYNVSV